MQVLKVAIGNCERRNRLLNFSRNLPSIFAYEVTSSGNCMGDRNSFIVFIAAGWKISVLSLRVGRQGAGGISDNLHDSIDSWVRQISMSPRQDLIMNHAAVQSWFGLFAPHLCDVVAFVALQFGSQA
jgi:hypothetical protein